MTLRAPTSGNYVEAKPGVIIRPTNTGLHLSGFVELPGQDVVHGFDVSKYQTEVDFDRARVCGANFVYVRLSGGGQASNETFYRFHWRDARYANLLVGPYHNLAIEDSKTQASLMSKSEMAGLSDYNLKYADQQAQLFLSRLVEMLNKDAPSNVSPTGDSQAFLPIVLDASWRPQAKGSALDRKLIGQIYGQMACRWLNQIDADHRLHNQTKILFTSPDVYHDYDLASAPCGLSTMPIWIFDPTPDAGKQGTSGSTPHQRLVAEVCIVHGVDRCVMQSYTSFGDFGIFPGKIDIDHGLDLDRFYGNLTKLKELLQHGG